MRAALEEVAADRPPEQHLLHRVGELDAADDPARHRMPRRQVDEVPDPLAGVGHRVQHLREDLAGPRLDMLELEVERAAAVLGEHRRLVPLHRLADVHRLVVAHDEAPVPGHEDLVSRPPRDAAGEAPEPAHEAAAEARKLVPEAALEHPAVVEEQRLVGGEVALQLADLVGQLVAAEVRPAARLVEDRRPLHCPVDHREHRQQERPRRVLRGVGVAVEDRPLGRRETVAQVARQRVRPGPDRRDELPRLLHVREPEERHVLVVQEPARVPGIVRRRVHRDQPGPVQQRPDRPDRAPRRLGHREGCLDIVERAVDLAERPREARAAQQSVEQPRQRLDLDPRRLVAGQRGQQPPEDRDRQPPTPLAVGVAARRDRRQPRRERREIAAHDVGEERRPEVQVGLEQDPSRTRARAGSPAARARRPRRGARPGGSGTAPRWRSRPSPPRPPPPRPRARPAGRSAAPAASPAPLRAAARSPPAASARSRGPRPRPPPPSARRAPHPRRRRRSAAPPRRSGPPPGPGPP